MRAAIFMIVPAIAISLVFSNFVSAQENTQYVYHLSPSTHPNLKQITVWLEQVTENNPQLIPYEKRPDSVSKPRMPVVSYFSISSDASIQKIEVEFVISHNWITQNNALENEVVLLKYENGWLEYPAQIVDNDESYVYYRADAPGVSIFALAAHTSEQAGILFPAVLITVMVLVISSIYWVLIRPRKSFVSLKKLKKGSGLPMIKDKEAVVSIEKPEEMKSEFGETRIDDNNIGLLKKLKKRTGGKSNGQST